MNTPILPLFASSLLLFSACVGGADDTGGKGDASTIAPNCEGSVCAEAEVDASFECYDETLELSFSMASRITGKVDQSFCGVDGEPGAQDLSVTIGPVDPSTDDTSALSFRLRGYDGPGTYALYHEEDEGDFEGLAIHGNNTVPDGVGNQDNEVGTMHCLPSPCEAVVAEGSEPIPNDEYAAHDFRVEVDIQCAPDGVLTDMLGCDGGGATCTFTEAPTLHVELVCAH